MSRKKNNSPHIDSADGKDRRPECCTFLPCRFVWRSFIGRQHHVSVFLLSGSPVGGWAEQGDTIYPLQLKIQTVHHYITPERDDDVFCVNTLTFYL